MPDKSLREEDLHQFIGTEHWYRHGLLASITFTDGAKYVADKGGAYWLLDEIALAQKFNTAVAAEPFQVWKLLVSQSEGILTCDDGDNHVVYTKPIPFTDFPLPEIKLYFVDNVILCCRPSIDSPPASTLKRLPHPRLRKGIRVHAPIYAVQRIRCLRGGSQSQLLRASDGGFYVTKALKNPQHVRVPANEMLASRLGQLLGLPMPRVEPIEVSEWLIANTSELSIELAGSSISWKPGLHLASLYVDDPSNAFVSDYLPEKLLEGVKNLPDFARVLVLDKWTCNSDGRQAVFSRKSNQRHYHATFIDQGYCFNDGEWTFPDSALRGVYARKVVYEHLRGWDAFEPALRRAEEIDVTAIWQIAAALNPEWYEFDRPGLDRLVETLYQRRRYIRDLITSFRESTRNPFPNWVDN
jgi:Family of unknown function (DUF6876)/HipA-like kinase